MYNISIIIVYTFIVPSIVHQCAWDIPEDKELHTPVSATIWPPADTRIEGLVESSILPGSWSP